MKMHTKNSRKHMCSTSRQSSELVMPAPCSPFPLSVACFPAQQWNYIYSKRKSGLFLPRTPSNGFQIDCISLCLFTSLFLSLSAAKHVWMAIVYRRSPIVICALWHLLMYCLWSASPCLPALLDGMIDVCVLCLPSFPTPSLPPPTVCNLLPATAATTTDLSKDITGTGTPRIAVAAGKANTVSRNWNHKHLNCLRIEWNRKVAARHLVVKESNYNSTTLYDIFVTSKKEGRFKAMQISMPDKGKLYSRKCNTSIL